MLLFQIGKGRKYPVTSMEFKPKHPGIDLIIADAPDGLPVPIISEHEVPSWNVREKDYFENLFYFGSYHLTDVGCILLMHAKDRKIERSLDDRSRAYDFRLVRDWWGYNPLPMTSTLPHQKLVSLSKLLRFMPIRYCNWDCMSKMRSYDCIRNELKVWGPL